MQAEYTPRRESIPCSSLTLFKTLAWGEERSQLNKTKVLILIPGGKTKGVGREILSMVCFPISNITN
jgi:hypothetical protein